MSFSIPKNLPQSHYGTGLGDEADKRMNEIAPTTTTTKKENKMTATTRKQRGMNKINENCVQNPRE